MDLNIKDVAELLRVSEGAVRRLLKEGKIPAYQLGRQYRFSKGEIEAWMVEPKEESGEKVIYTNPRGGLNSFALFRAMNKGGVLVDVVGESKEEIIRCAMGEVAGKIGFDPEVISELLLDREELASTALNKGIAIPHPRDSVLEQPGSDFIVTVFLKNPVDYGALDGQKVHTLFFLFSSSDKSHLQLLSKLAHLCSQPKMLEYFQSKPTLDNFLNTIKEWETKL